MRILSLLNLPVTLLPLLPLATAQTFSSCNPTEKACPPDPGLTTTTFTADFTTGPSSASPWNLTAGPPLTYTPAGAHFTISHRGDSPTLESPFTFLFGTLTVRMTAAPGTGIVSSIVLQSADLDELDWEFLGGRPGEAQSNYFGRGVGASYDRAMWHGVPGAGVQSTVHEYTIIWTPESTTWAIDGSPVRTLHAREAGGGSSYPQTPMRVRIGVWAGGDPGNREGTIGWAGGETDFNQGPFGMVVESVKVANENPAASYVWTDRTGSLQSIRIEGGEGGAGGVNGAGADGGASASGAAMAASSSESEAVGTASGVVSTEEPTSLSTSSATSVTSSAASLSGSVTGTQIAVESAVISSTHAAVVSAGSGVIGDGMAAIAVVAGVVASWFRL